MRERPRAVEFVEASLERSAYSLLSYSGLQLGLRALPSDSALNETVGIGLRSEDLGVLAGVVETLEPGEINLEVVLIRKSIVDSLNQRHIRKDLVAHLVHSVLDASTIVLGKDIESSVLDAIESLVKLRNDRLDLVQSRELLPLPTSLDVCAKDAVPGFGQTGVFVPVESIERGPGALEHKKTLEARLNGDTLAFSSHGLNNALLLAIAEEGVWMRLAVDGHAGPFVLDDLDVAGVDMRVGLDEVVADDGSKELGRCDRVLLCEDVAGLLLGVCGDDYRVVGLGVRGVDVALEEDADSHLHNGLNSSLLVLVDLVQPDVVLAIAGIAELRHVAG